MSNKKQKEDINALDKKAVVFRKEKKKKILFSIIPICALVVAAVLFFSFSGKKEQPQSDYRKTSNTTQEVTYPVDLFADGTARHFQYNTGNNIVVKYFVLKSSDNVIRTAFDACDVCWPSGKGYYQEGDHMVCRNCGRRFASIKVNEVKGGCNPAPLNRRVEGYNLIIEVKDIIEGSRYFDFSKGRDA